MGRGPRTPPMLEVRQMYEPTRLAAACLEAAYARIVPTPWRRTRSGHGAARRQRLVAERGSSGRHAVSTGGASWLMPRTVTMA